MIIVYFNKFGNTNKNKNFIKNRQKLEKKFKSFSFIYSAKNVFILILYKKFDEYNFYEDDRFIVHINGLVENNKHRLRAKVILSEFRLKKKSITHKYCGNFSIFIFDKLKNQSFFITDYFNSHKIYSKNEKKRIIFSTNISLPILLNLVDKKISEQFFYRYTLGNYRSSHGRVISPIKGLNSLPRNSIIKFCFKSDLEIKTLEDYRKIKGLKKYNYSKIKDLLDKYFNNFYSQFLGKEKSTCILVSGGFDSTLLAYYWKKFVKKKIKAYTIYFDDINLKDTSFSKILSKSKNLDQTMINFSKKSLLNELKNVYKKYDYPIATVSQLAFINLYNQIDKKYKFILTGYGGDYLFGGSYNSFLYNLSDLKKKSKKKFNLELNYWIKLHSYGEYFKDESTFEKFEKKFCYKSKGMIKDSFREEVDFRRLLKKKIKIKEIKNDIKQESEYLQTYTKWAYIFESVAPVSDTDVFLDYDKNLKTFTPFIDKKLQDLSLNTPSSLKIKKGVNRIFLRNLLKKKVSNELIKEKDKFGFNCPLDKWIREDKEIYNFVKKKLFKKKSVCKKIYGKNFLEKILISHKKKEKNYSMVIWQILNFELWYEKWIKKQLI